MNRSLLIAALAALCPVAAVADDFAPFYTFSKGPLAQLYGLPAAEGGVLLAPGARSTALSVDLTSHHVYRNSANETLFFDGESYRTTLVFRQGLARGYEWGFDLPYTAHEGGFLDHTIYEWHDFFGLPQGGRGSVPNNQLQFQYVRNGIVLLDLKQATSGVGDLRLHGARRLGTHSALRATLKLPTGDSRELLGSGAADLALWLSGEGTATGASVWYFGTAGALALGSGDILPDQQHRLVAFGSAGAAWSPAGWPTFQLQLDGHTPFYRDTTLVPLGASSLSIVFGGRAKIGARTHLDLGVSEDLLLATAPDVTFHLRLSSCY